MEIEKATQRMSKKQQLEMKRQVEIMQNRIRMLKIIKQKEQVLYKFFFITKKQIRQQVADYKNEMVQNVRNQYYDYLKQQVKQKEFRDRALSEFREKNKQLKNEQSSYRHQIKETLLNQKRLHSEMMKRQSIDNDKYISEQKAKSISYNKERKSKVQVYEQEQQLKLERYKASKMEFFREQHKQMIMESFKQKDQAMQQLESLWVVESELIDDLKDRSKLNTSFLESASLK